MGYDRIGRRFGIGSDIQLEKHGLQQGCCDLVAHSYAIQSLTPSGLYINHLRVNVVTVQIFSLSCN
jgi:hypothetical protein